MGIHPPSSIGKMRRHPHRMSFHLFRILKQIKSNKQMQESMLFRWNNQRSVPSIPFPSKSRSFPSSSFSFFLFLSLSFSFFLSLLVSPQLFGPEFTRQTVHYSPHRIKSNTSKGEISTYIETYKSIQREREKERWTGREKRNRNGSGGVMGRGVGVGGEEKEETHRECY